MKGISRRTLLSVGAVGAAGLALEANAALRRDLGGHDLESCCPIVELRQYTLHPGTRARFTQLFEREFIESQEALGMSLIGQFHDLDDPDRFVWMRGFADMETRRAALSGFYGGEVWRAHRDAANACMLDSDNVLLLRESAAESGVGAARLRRPAAGKPAPAGIAIVGVHYLDSAQAGAFADFFEARMRPALAAIGLPPIARFRTEGAANNFPRLPVRTSDTVFVWLATVVDAAEGERCLRALREGQSAWREGAPEAILHQLARRPEILRLAPTARSALRN
jgi:hypothetical protein